MDTINSAYELDEANAQESVNHLAEVCKTATARGEEKQIQAVSWLLRFHHSCPEILDQVVYCRRGSGLVPRLVKNGLVTTIETHQRGVKGMPAKVVMLTKAGLELAETHSTSQTHYDLNPARVNMATLRHDLLVQSLTLARYQAEKIVSFTTEHEMGEKHVAEKRPDAVWIYENGKKAMVEVELTGKFGRPFDEFVYRVISALHHGQYDYLILFSQSQAIIERYSAALKPGQVIHLWKKDSQRKWAIENSHTIPESVHGKIKCEVIS